MISFFAVLVQTAAEELADLGAGDVEMHSHISAVLRRLLPALRIMSKWVKLHLEYISRFSSTSNGDLAADFPSFWTQYHRFIPTLARLFPLAELPTLTDPFEEDMDMRGFAPFSRGMLTLNACVQEINGHHEAPHPNEEQLMRIADLQVDAKLLMQSEVSLLHES